ncbi:MAG: glutamyl-tRNA reductase, partial [Nocardioides sp.]
MSILVVGISHNSAPVSLLETIARTGATKLLTEAMVTEHVSEATVISTCNRIEIYSEVDRFHGSVEDLSRLLVERSELSLEVALPHLYVHYDDGAVSHLFNVAAGLDSMAIGEAQILGQTREALRLGQELGAVGPALNSLFQQALRVGKRAHAETGIDTAAPSLVGFALDRAGDLSGKKAVVIGAGAMAGLATSTLAMRGVADLVIANRSAARADRLAREYAGRAAALSDLADLIREADVVVSCAGAGSRLVTADMIEERGADRPLMMVDLALPHDIDRACAEIANVTLLDLIALQDHLVDTSAGREVAAVRDIVANEVEAFLAARRAASVTPTVVALRDMATSVVESEMARLVSRVPDLDEATRREILNSVRRVAEKLLHTPTVRVKELANSTGPMSYEKALLELFALDPESVQAVTRAVLRGEPSPLESSPAESSP